MPAFRLSRRLINTVTGLCIGLFTSTTLAATAITADAPIGGKPPPDVKPSIPDYAAQLKYQRAFELATWAMPAVGIYGFRRATEAVGGSDNTILAWSKVAGPNAELLTANNTTPISWP